MNKYRLIDLINKKITECETTQIAPDEKVIFVKNFLEKNSTTSIENITKIDLYEAYIAYLISTIDVPFKRIVGAVNGIRPLLEKSFDPNSDLFFSTDEFKFMADVIEDLGIFKYETYFADIEEELPEEIMRMLEKIVMRIDKYDIDCITPFSLQEYIYLVVDLDATDKASKEFSETLFFQEMNSLLYANTLAATIKQAKEMYELLVNEDAEEFNALPLESRKRAMENSKKLRSQFLKDKIRVDIIRREFDKITRYYNHEDSILKSKTKTQTRKIRDYKSLIEKLNILDENREITDIEKYLSKIKDEDVRLAFLQYAYTINQNINQKLEAEYQELLSENNMEYRSLFSNYDITVDDNYLSQINYSMEDLKTALEQLNQMGVTSSKNVLSIILHSDKETILSIKDLYDKQFVSIEELNNYPVIFSKTSKSYKNALSNIESFIANGVNPRYLAKSPRTLLADNETLTENLASLKEATYLEFIDRESNIDFMSRKDLKRTIGMIERLGYQEEVQEDIDLLNASFDRWKRVAVLLSIGETPDSEELSEVLTSKTFFIPDDELDDHIDEECIANNRRKTTAPQYVKTKPKETTAE